MIKDPRWDSERLAALTLDELKTVRTNAIRLGKSEIISLCDGELARRSPAKKRVASSSVSNDGKVVGGIHLVCAGDNGVSLNSDGTFWSGTWVVAKEHAVKGEQINAYVALHEKKSEPSYRQGIIKGWRIGTRDRQYADAPVQTEEGIEFLIEPTPDAYAWVGDGTGEKGYLWVECISTPTSAPVDHNHGDRNDGGL
jgi:hypothetical protein